MAKKFKRGDRVSWNTSQGRTTGRIKKRLTSAIRVKGHRVAASPENPEYLVESDRSGAQAAHKPDALDER